MIAATQYTIRQLTKDDVHAFLTWCYDAPYDLYNLNMDDVDSAIAFFLLADNGYLAVRDAHDALIGFCCFGVEGQVPGGDYSRDALDVGIGMKPESTGKGLGHGFVAAVLAYAETTYACDRLRATVAAFNRRSLRVFEKHGFRRQSSFVSDTSQPRDYVILVKERGNGSRQSTSANDA